MGMPVSKSRSFLSVPSAFFGILLISAATLLFEIAWTRVLSVTLWYHFAFMALSTALFGFGAAGVLLSLRKSRAPVSRNTAARLALATPLAFVAGYTLSNLTPYEPFSLGQDSLQWLYLLLFYLVSTVPFFFSGLTVAALLSRYAGDVHRLYLFDLAGAGIGAFLAVALLPVTGGTGTLFMAAGLAGVGGVLAARPIDRWGVATLALSLCLFGSAPYGDALFPVRISRNKLTGDGVPLGEVFTNPEFHRYTGWNATSRVDVVAWRDNSRQSHRTIFIDGGTAVTRLAHPMGPISGLAPGRDEESFFLNLQSNPRVLVLGSGGGREVLLAVRSGAESVTAVEINPDINHIVQARMADFTGRLYHLPQVRVYTDEARHFINRTEARFDLIHLPHTISNAAMASGSLSLAENYLLTKEAFEAYLARLTDDGVLLMTRPEAHLPRLFSTARAVLAKDDSALGARLIAWRRPSRGQSFYGGFALKKRPFTADEVARFKQTLKRMRLEPLFLPNDIARPPYADLVAGKPLSDIRLDYPAILTPATDDKPFFNRRVSFADLSFSDFTGIFSRGKKGRLALEVRPVTEAALLALLVESVLVALIFIIGPLVLFRRRMSRKAGRLSTIATFFALGLAYITVEMGFIHRLTLYLGRPAVVMATVLGTLLLSSGVGSAFAARFKGGRAPFFASLAAAAAAIISALLLPLVISSTLGLSAPARIAVSIAALAVPGFVMGMPFPLLIRRLESTYPERIPWAFGINGLASVIGTVTALLVAMTLGQTAVLAAGILCYLAAAVASGKMI